MTRMDNETIERFDQSLEVWTDSRFASREQLRALAMFGLYLVNLSEHDGWVYVGHSYKRGVGLGSLVIKAMSNDTSVVTFISARTFMNCVAIFLKRLEDGVLEWRDDKYP